MDVVSICCLSDANRRRFWVGPVVLVLIALALVRQPIAHAATAAQNDGSNGVSVQGTEPNGSTDDQNDGKFCPFESPCKRK